MRILYKYLTTSLFPRHMEPEVVGLGVWRGRWLVMFGYLVLKAKVPKRNLSSLCLWAAFSCMFFFPSVSGKRFSNTCWNARKSPTLWKVGLVLLSPSTDSSPQGKTFVRRVCILSLYFIPHTAHSRGSHKSCCNVKFDPWKKEKMLH